MSAQRAKLTPQMLQYDDFDDRGSTRWLPYLMYFHRADYQSAVINTDHLGFRFSHGPDQRAAAGVPPTGPVRLLVGSSTAYGIGVTSDAATMASRLWSADAPSAPWLNFAGRSFSSTQEALLFLLYRHVLPEIEQIVFFSGLNDLALSRLPSWQRGDSGGFFNCGEYFDQMENLRASHRNKKSGFMRRSARRSSAPPPQADEPVRPLAERIASAVELTARNLEAWRLLAPGVPISYVLQPLATWIRDEPAPQERLLFAELDEVSNFWHLYGDIATMEAGRAYAAALRAICEKQGVTFVDSSPAIAEAVDPQEWLFVDRAHFTDRGSELVTGIVARQLELA